MRRSLTRATTTRPGDCSRKPRRGRQQRTEVRLKRSQMSGWELLLDSAGLVLLLVICYGLMLVLRRRVLSRHGGTFELSLRVRTSESGRGWVLGLGRYRDERLEWVRISSPSPRPRRAWQRAQMQITGQREPIGSE